jgi:hypothetical protein
MAPITWRNVAAPDFSPAARMLNDAAANWSGAGQTLAGAFQRGAEIQKARASAQAAGTMAKVSGEAGVDPALDKILGEIGAENLTPEMQSAIMNLRGTAMGYDRARGGSGRSGGRSGGSPSSGPGSGGTPKGLTGAAAVAASFDARTTNYNDAVSGGGNPAPAPAPAPVPTGSSASADPAADPAAQPAAQSAAQSAMEPMPADLRYALAGLTGFPGDAAASPAPAPAAEPVPAPMAEVAAPVAAPSSPGPQNASEALMAAVGGYAPAPQPAPVPQMAPAPQPVPQPVRAQSQPAPQPAPAPTPQPTPQPTINLPVVPNAGGGGASELATMLMDRSLVDTANAVTNPAQAAPVGPQVTAITQATGKTPSVADIAKMATYNVEAAQAAQESRLDNAEAGRDAALGQVEFGQNQFNLMKDQYEFGQVLEAAQTEQQVAAAVDSVMLDPDIDSFEEAESVIRNSNLTPELKNRALSSMQGKRESDPTAFSGLGVVSVPQTAQDSLAIAEEALLQGGFNNNPAGELNNQLYSLNAEGVLEPDPVNGRPLSPLQQVDMWKSGRNLEDGAAGPSSAAILEDIRGVAADKGIPVPILLNAFVNNDMVKTDRVGAILPWNRETVDVVDIDALGGWADTYNATNPQDRIRAEQSLAGQARQVQELRSDLGTNTSSLDRLVSQLPEDSRTAFEIALSNPVATTAQELLGPNGLGPILDTMQPRTRKKVEELITERLQLETNISDISAALSSQYLPDAPVDNGPGFAAQAFETITNGLSDRAAQPAGWELSQDDPDYARALTTPTRQGTKVDLKASPAAQAIDRAARQGNILGDLEQINTLLATNGGAPAAQLLGWIGDKFTPVDDIPTRREARAEAEAAMEWYASPEAQDFFNRHPDVLARAWGDGKTPSLESVLKIYRNLR